MSDPRKIAEGLSSFDRRILDELLAAPVYRARSYHDWTGNEFALQACNRLAEADLCRVVWDGPACWRVYRSPEQTRVGLAVRDILKETQQ